MKKKTIQISHHSTLADMLSPLSVYAKLRDHFNNPLLLEGADHHDRSDSKSYICLEPLTGFEAHGSLYSITAAGEKTQTHKASVFSEVLAAFHTFLNSFEAPEYPLPFPFCGLCGFSSFEAVQYMEEIKLHNPADEIKSNPDLKYQLFQFVLVFDHFTNELHLIQNEIEGIKSKNVNLEHILNLVQVADTPLFSFKATGQESAGMSDEYYRTIVARGITHCQRGDVFQVVLSREFRQKFTGDDFNVYRCLRSINPSPYSFYFDYNDFRLMGSSPESQLQVSNGIASINPIAGTIKRTDNITEDQKRAEQLKKDPKENSEHVMLVDLARNDLSKHASDVKVDVYGEVQYFSHVIHMVSKVSGTLAPEISPLSVYADTFPAGTLSGAPKYRALQIIDDCEKTARNFYGGAIGFFGFDGTVNHAIIIRSLLSKHNTLVYQAGAGVIVDSTPEGELQEVNNKLAALREAIQTASQL